MEPFEPIVALVQARTVAEEAGVGQIKILGNPAPGCMAVGPADRDRLRVIQNLNLKIQNSESTDRACGMGLWLKSL